LAGESTWRATSVATRAAAAAGQQWLDARSLAARARSVEPHPEERGEEVDAARWMAKSVLKSATGARNPPEHTPAVFKSYLSYARLEETNGRAKNLVIARS
jgi:hypothetical protein